MMQSKDNANTAIEQDDKDVESDVYASEGLAFRKKEARKRKFWLRKSKKASQKLVVGNGSKRTELGN